MKSYLLYSHRNIIIMLMFLFSGLPLLSQTTITYTYDQKQRLSTVSYSTGTTITYTYDAEGNRTGHVITAGNNASCGVPQSPAIAAVTASGATLSWAAVAGASSYQVQVTTSGSTSWNNWGTSTSTSYIITGLTASTAYQARVYAICGQYNSNPSTAVSFTTTAAAACGTVTGLAASNVAATTATLSWAAVSGVSSYTVQISSNNGSIWSNLATGLTSTTYNASALTASTAYQFRVQAICSNGLTGSWSSIGNFTTIAPLTCAVASGLIAANITSTSAYLSWGSVAGASGYNIQLSINSGASWNTLYNNAPSPSYTAINLTAGTNYQYRVQTICSNGVSASWSSGYSFVTITNQTVTEQTVKLLKDIEPGTGSGSPAYMTQIGTKTFFWATTTSAGQELWVTDGTSAGTFMVKDIYPGTSGSGAAEIYDLNGIAIFTPTDGVNGRELWRSDGTTSGTYMIKDIHSLPGSGSYPTSFARLGSYLYFFASSYTGSGTGQITNLWRTDGTNAGTIQITTAGLSGTKALTIGSVIYFVGSETNTGNELWKSDGTSAGTVMVLDINPGTASGLNSSLPWFTNVNGTLYFNANNGISGYELWKSNGLSSNTEIVKDIYPGSTTSGIYYMTSVGNIAYFKADDGSGAEVWRSDGSLAGTYMLKDIFPGGSSYPVQLSNYNGNLMFGANDGIYGNELWKSDGTSSGTLMVKNLHPSSSGVTNSFKYVNNNGLYYFVGNDGVSGYELNISDGTTTGTNLLKDIYCGAPNSGPDYFTVSSNKLYFNATNATSGVELWTDCAVTKPTVTNVNIPSGTSATLSASNCNSCNWYSDNSCSSSIATGNTFNTPILSASTTYYVMNTSDGCESAKVPVTVTIGGGTGVNSPCVTNHTLSNTITSSTIYEYEASDYIVGSNVIASGAIIDYDAANYVLLNPGFEAQTGAVFLAIIDGCGGAKAMENPSQPFPAQPEIVSGDQTVIRDSEVEDEDEIEEEEAKEDEAVEDKNPTLLFTDIRIIPNPLLNNGRLEFNLSEEKNLRISVYDLSGRQVMLLADGESYYEGINTIDLNTADLMTGAYLVVMEGDGIRESIKFVKASSATREEESKEEPESELTPVERFLKDEK